jgi:hypothetical protein
MSDLQTFRTTAQQLHRLGFNVNLRGGDAVDCAPAPLRVIGPDDLLSRHERHDSLTMAGRTRWRSRPLRCSSLLSVRQANHVP